MIALTPTETGILLALASGDSQAEIAAERWVSPHTVKEHVKNVREKLGAWAFS